MIKHLYIKNFQSHSETSLDFSEGVNVVIGQSDSGKTAIARALDWVLNNRPQGDSFRRQGEDTTEVFAYLDSGHRIERKKRKTVDNTYRLAKGEESQPFKAFGASVPEEIAQVVNMSDINWQRQLDSPFLLSMTPGDIARKLNEIVHLDVIDSALSKVSGKIRDNTVELAQHESYLAQVREKLETFNYLEDMERLVMQVEDLAFRKQVEELANSTLENLISRIVSAQTTLKDANKLLPLEDQVNDIMETKNALEAWTQREDRLKDLGRRIKHARSTKEEYSKKCYADGPLSCLVKDFQYIQGLSEKELRLVLIINKVEDVTEERGRAVKDLDRLAAQMPKVCPTCRRPL